MSWIQTVYSSELKKIFSYRMDFWVQFPALVAMQIFLAYYLWDSIYENLGRRTMEGYSFYGLMLYYLLAPLVDRFIRGVELRFLSGDIYEGTLSRYLIYPVSVFLFKYVQQAAQSSVAYLQFVLTLGVFLIFFKMPDEMQISPGSFLFGTAAIIFASVMYFVMVSIFECIAFWADNVWSLLVMLRLSILFLGGGMIPLNFFPDRMVEILKYTPFPYMAFFPVRTFLGFVTPAEFASGMAVMLLWTIFLAFILRFFWRKGLLSYSGVGM